MQETQLHIGWVQRAAARTLAGTTYCEKISAVPAPSRCGPCAEEAALHPCSQCLVMHIGTQAG